MNLKNRLERIETATGQNEPLRVMILRTNIDISEEGPFNYDCTAGEDIARLCPEYRKAEKNHWRGLRYGGVVMFCPPCGKCEGL